LVNLRILPKPRQNIRMTELDLLTDEEIIGVLGGLATEDLEEFKNGDARFAVLSTTSYSMGVDLSWISGCCLFYSMPWSGAVWSQVLDRQLKFDRKRKALVAVLLHDGGVDEVVYDTISQKQNFNLRRYRNAKGVEKA